MLALANARGVPGTATAIVRARGERFVLTCHHVLYGDRARTGERVWALPPDPDGDPVPLGRTAGGQLGRVGPSTAPHFIDCALVALDHESTGALRPPWLCAALDALARPGTAASAVGAEVVKHGATTGTTRGAIATDRYVTEPWLEGRVWSADDQLLVDSADDALVFSAPGDSGAALLDDAGRVVGLLWGTTPSGQGIASPIAPVLAHLAVEL